MSINSVHFSIAKHAQWAPGLSTDAAWQAWLEQAFLIDEQGASPPAVAVMPAMLRRRARFLGRMALEVAYACVSDEHNLPIDLPDDVPTLFCSRHGEVGHSIELLQEQIREGTVSPIGFSSAVHNATAGLFSIARKDRNNHIALAAGSSTIEHAVIEACGLLHDGAPAVLLIHYEHPLPDIFKAFEDSREQAYAWAWLMVPATKNSIRLSWQTMPQSLATDAPAAAPAAAADNAIPAGLQVLRFQLSQPKEHVNLVRQRGGQRWVWSHHDDAA